MISKELPDRSFTAWKYLRHIQAMAGQLNFKLADGFPQLGRQLIQLI